MTHFGWSVNWMDDQVDGWDGWMDGGQMKVDGWMDAGWMNYFRALDL